jgi:hypothetical protein
VTVEALPRSWRREDAEAASSTLTARDGAAPGTAQARRRWEKLQPQVAPRRCVASCSSAERCEGKRQYTTTRAPPGAGAMLATELAADASCSSPQPGVTRPRGL